MSARIARSGAAALLLCVAAAGFARPGVHALRSSRMVLPEEPIAPEGDADAQLVQANCLACHSASMIAYQPSMDAQHWAAEVDKMRSVYKAPVSEEDARRLPAILARLQAAGR